MTNLELAYAIAIRRCTRRPSPRGKVRRQPSGARCDARPKNPKLEGRRPEDGLLIFG